MAKQALQTVTVTRAQTLPAERRLIIALAGNPNAGKTTLFNALTGMRQKVANYPGVTVERKEGVLMLGSERARLIDLPGLYSLNANSVDEEIARDALTGKIPQLPAPDCIVAVVDATNLDRNLYLFTQLVEYGIPIVVALTMIDEAEARETEIDAVKLSSYLKVPVVGVVAGKRRGLEELAGAIESALGRAPHAFADFPFMNNDEEEAGNGNASILARYSWISDVVQESVKTRQSTGRVFSEKLDGVLTHKVFGLLILAGILLFVFQTIFSWAQLPMDLLDSVFGAMQDTVRNALPPGLLNDLLANGVIAGVGGVMIFLPQIVLLFLFISILEDTGYMARAAFLLDRLMSKVGLHGKAFVPLMSSFACAIPGVMATRTIENPKDRLATIMIAPFMSCSARLPVYTLMVGAFFTGQYVFGFVSVGAVLILSMYVLGVIAAIIVAFILKRTILKGPTPPLLMELPPYRMPNFKVAFINVFQRAGMFVKRAGTVILAISIILWALANFPRPPQAEAAAPVIAERQIESANQSADEKQKQIDTEAAAEQLRYSLAGRMGKTIEPVIAPLGYDWKIGIGLISSFAARETFVSTMSILYNVGKDEGATSESLLQAMRDAKRDDGSPVWTPLLALTTMMFYLLAFQCMSTFATVRRETNSWGWTFFMVGYMTALAYVVTFLVYQGGKLFGF
ncbi:MAG: ferrous iron transport protein B [Acidobacteria bacterium]|nr:ferrous iron transport protein B [Acidobacteriota bacterium]MCW5949421.1 ferrous iron transport protein B [Pyrinomonadaceae bacterium]